MSRDRTVLSSPGGALTLDIDLRHGGRWCSLRRHGREWLWRRPDPRRRAARPGDRFVDAGGMEECVPTVRGVPDHGDAWTRPWSGTASDHCVTTPEFELRRRVRLAGDDRVAVTYWLSAPPGFRYVWAGHMLLDVSPAATLALPAGTPVRVYTEGEAWVLRAWPDPADTRLDHLGPDDGTALSAVVLRGQAEVCDGPDRLRLSVQGAGQPVSLGLWRNLGGWPACDPYRSIGVEPMLGRVWDRDAAGEDDTARVGPDGCVEWTMTLDWEVADGGSAG